MAILFSESEQEVACTLNTIIYATLLFLPPLFMSWTQKYKTFLCTHKPYFSQILFTNLSKSVLVNEIHPPHRCDISRCWLDRLIIAQMCLRLATIKGHIQMCSFTVWGGVWGDLKPVSICVTTHLTHAVPTHLLRTIQFIFCAPYKQIIITFQCYSKSIVIYAY